MNRKPLSLRQKRWIAALLTTGALGAGSLILGPRLMAGLGSGDTHEAHEGHGPGETSGRAPASAASISASAPAAHGEDELIALDEAQQKAMGLATEAAGPGTLQTLTEFQGEIRFNEDRMAHVVPRVAGVAEAVQVQQGERVRAGQVLAVLASTALSDQRSELLTAQRRLEAAQATHERERRLWEARISAEQDFQQAQTALREAEIAVANARHKLAALGAGASSSSLSRLEIRAPFEATVVERHLSRGEAVREDANLFTLADLRTVWADFAVAPKDLAVVRVGQAVEVSSTAFDEKVQGQVSYVGPLLGEQTRTARARVTLDNPQGAWRPGLFVTVRVKGAAQTLPLTVPVSAVQAMDQQSVVFVARPGGFERRAVQLGRSDGVRSEVTAGLKAGERIAVRQVQVLKSELGKSSAEHSH